MSRYVLTPSARADLEDIADFISQDNREAARRVISELRQAMRRLAERPGLGHVREDLAPRSIRFWPVYSYLIVYLPDSQPLNVLRVVHGARDISSLL